MSQFPWLDADNHSDKVTSSKSIQDEELKTLLTKPLRESKKKNKKAAANGAEAKKEEETKA